MSSKYFTIATEIEKKLPLLLKSNISYLPSENLLCVEYAVSRQTVRNALSLLVQEGYVVAQQGRGYRLTGKLPNGNNLISIILPDAENYTYPSFIKKLREAFLNLGFKCQLHFTNGKYSVEASILRSLTSNPPRLIIIEGLNTAFTNPNLELFYKLQELGSNICFIGTPYTKDFYSIGLDYFEEGRLITKTLLELGHKKVIGLFPCFNQAGLDMQSGWLSVLMEKLPSADDPCFYMYDRDFLQDLRSGDNYKKDINRILPNIADATAIVCFNDEVAYWMIKGLVEYGYNCPEDISVTGGDGSYLSRLSNPIISTMENRTFTEEIIKYAGQIMSGTAKKHEFIKRTFIETNSISRVNPISM